MTHWVKGSCLFECIFGVEAFILLFRLFLVVVYCYLAPHGNFLSYKLQLYSDSLRVRLRERRGWVQYIVYSGSLFLQNCSRVSFEQLRSLYVLLGLMFVIQSRSQM